jgi:predicted DNA-binding protein (MmcQ/YjbR family)
MRRDLVNTLSRDLPGATWSDPWGGGHDAWKVGGKLFALVGARDGNGVNVKCPDVETARLLIDMGRANRAPYLHASWVRIPFGLVPDEELADRIRISYGLIRKGLTRKVQATLEPWPI